MTGKEGKGKEDKCTETNFIFVYTVKTTLTVNIQNKWQLEEYVVIAIMIILESTICNQSMAQRSPV